MRARTTGATRRSGRRYGRWGRWCWAFLLGLLLSSCSMVSPGKVVVGSGDVSSQTRTVAAFTEIQVGGGLRVELAHGPQQVVVSAQPNILDITTTTVAGSRLTIDTTSGFATPHGLVVKVRAPTFTALELSGGASASGTVGTDQDLRLTLSGGARANLSGTATRLRLEASGGAVAELGDLRARDASIDLSGGVVATLDVMSSLKGTASGGVVVTLTRTPSAADVATSGGAVVRQP